MLIQDEDECAEFISKGKKADELEFLPLVFEHFKTRKIFDAIKSNCEITFSHKYSTESEKTELKRKEMFSNMQSYFEI